MFVVYLRLYSNDEVENSSLLMECTASFMSEVKALYIVLS